MSTELDPNVVLFAAWVKAEEGKERDAKKAARKAREAEKAERAVVDTKDAAAAEVKRLRNDPKATPEARAEADAAYRSALAAVVVAETGEAPDWAPPAPEPEAEAPPAEAEAASEPADDAEASPAEAEATSEPAAQAGEPDPAGHEGDPQAAPDPQ